MWIFTLFMNFRKKCDFNVRRYSKSVDRRKAIAWNFLEKLGHRWRKYQNENLIHRDSRKINVFISKTRSKSHSICILKKIDYTYWLPKPNQQPYYHSFYQPKYKRHFQTLSYFLCLGMLLWHTFFNYFLSYFYVNILLENENGWREIDDYKLFYERGEKTMGDEIRNSIL